MQSRFSVLLVLLAVFGIGGWVMQWRQSLRLMAQVSALREEIKTLQDAGGEDALGRWRREVYVLASRIERLDHRLGPLPEHAPLAPPFEASLEKRLETLEAAVTFDKLMKTRQSLESAHFNLQKAAAEK